MSYTVYVLESETSGRLYIGQTNDLERRLLEHDGGHVVSTRGRGPWRLLHTWPAQTRQAAMALEQRLKAMKRPDRVRAEIEASRPSEHE